MKRSSALAAVDVDEMAARCGIAVDTLVTTATEFATADSAAIFYDLGVEQTPFSTLISYLIRVLLTLTNNVGRTGGNVFFETIGAAILDQSRVRSRSERWPPAFLAFAPSATSACSLRRWSLKKSSSITLPAQIDPKLLDGHVGMPNGFGMQYIGEGSVHTDGANQNELTDVTDRDPFTGIPHHRYVLCRIEAVQR